MPMAAAAAVRNGCGPVDGQLGGVGVVGRVGGGAGAGGDGPGDQGVGDGGVHDHRVDVDHRADRVQVHRRPLLGDGDDEHRVRQPAGEHPPGEALGPAGRRPLADAHRHDALGEQQHVAALEVLELGAVELLHPGEAGMVGVDGGGDGALAVAGRHGQRRHGHLVAHPDRRVAGEQQVGQRRDDEVPAVHDLVGQPVTAAQLVVRQPGDQQSGQVLRVEPDRCVVTARCSVAPSRGSSTAAAISSARADGKDSTSASSRSRCSTSTPRS